MDASQATPFWIAAGTALASLAGNVAQVVATWRRSRSENTRAEAESAKLRAEVEQAVLENLLRLNREAQEASDKRYQQLKADNEALRVANEALREANEALGKSGAELRKQVEALSSRLKNVEAEYQRAIVSLRNEWDIERAAFTERQVLMSEEIQELKHQPGTRRARGSKTKTGD